MRNKLEHIAKFATDFLPVALFFLCYKCYDIKVATIAIIATTIFCTFIYYLVAKKISYMSLVTLMMMVFFGGMTIYSGDVTFIKIKPTVVNLIFFLILVGGAFFRKGLLKFVFVSNNFAMSERNWLVLSLRFAFFFLFVAILNELVWRNFSENIWVNFKVFGIVTINIVFVLTQLAFINRNRIEK